MSNWTTEILSDAVGELLTSHGHDEVILLHGTGCPILADDGNGAWRPGHIFEGRSVHEIREIYG